MRRTLLAAAFIALSVPVAASAHAPTPCGNPSTVGGAAYTVASTVYPQPVVGHVVVDVYMANKGTICGLP